MRIFLDANIIFSAVLNDGAVRRLLGEFEERGHTLVINGYVWEEAYRNLERHKSSSLETLHHLAVTWEICPGVPSKKTIDTIEEDIPLKDRPILAAAIELRCEFLLTGDRKHFGRFFGKRVRGIGILSPLQAARRLLAP